MRVQELIDVLSKLNPEAVVCVCADNGANEEDYGDLSTCNIREVNEGGPYVGDPATDAGYVVAIWCPWGVSLEGVNIDEEVA